MFIAITHDDDDDKYADGYALCIIVNTTQINKQINKYKYGYGDTDTALYLGLGYVLYEPSANYLR